MGSPSRFGSCRDLSPESKLFSRRNSATRSRTPSPTKSTASDEAASAQKVFSPLRSAEKKSAEVSVHHQDGDDDDDDDDFDSGNNFLSPEITFIYVKIGFFVPTIHPNLLDIKDQ